MELTELQNIWQQYDRKISENTQINKEILRLMLLSKPQKRFSWIKFSAGFSTLSPLIFVTVLLVLNVQFYIGLNFYIGLALFLPVYTITYIWDIEYFRLIRKIDFSMTLLTLKKEIAQLEKYKIKKTRIRYMLMPVAISGFLLMIIHSMNFSLNFVSIIPLLLMVVVFLLSMYITFKYSIYERFKKLNKEIECLQQLERE
jgi:hypothetical protein